MFFRAKTESEHADFAPSAERPALDALMPADLQTATLALG
jgi:hypothetical protein